MECRFSFIEKIERLNMNNVIRDYTGTWLDRFPICMPPEPESPPESEEEREAYQTLRNSTIRLNRYFLGLDDAWAKWLASVYKWCSYCGTGTMHSTEDECTGVTWREYVQMTDSGIAGSDIESKCKGR